MSMGQNNFQLFFISEYEVVVPITFLTYKCLSENVSSVPEVISQSKIYACEKCAKVFSCKKKLIEHQRKLKHNKNEVGN